MNVCSKSIFPRNVDALYWISLCYRKEGEGEKEREAFEAILAIDSTHAKAWNHLGVIAQEAGDFEGALTRYDEAIRHDSMSVDARNNRGSVLVDLGRTKEAMAEFDRALAINPRFALAHFGKARVYAERQDLEGLARELQLTLRYDPDFQPARAWLANLRRQNAQRQGQ